MTHLAVREYERLYRGREGEQTGDRRGDRRLLSDKHFRRLRSFDESQAGEEGELLFEWRRGKVWPKQWVGVVQVTGLTVEILPKLASPPKETSSDSGTAFARANLLYMLALAGEIPVRPRDVADLAVGRSSMLDILVDIFARRLLDELKIGTYQTYEKRRRNRRVLKGKLQFGEHLKKNAARKDRFFVEYDEYLQDNDLNRIFRAACRTLRRAVHRPRTEQKLKQCLMLLDDVEDVQVEPETFDRVHFDRQNRRFRESFDFCRMLYLGQAPAAAFGRVRTYSVLFDMNALYEKFLTAFIRRHVLTGELGERLELDPQSKGLRKYLLWTGPDDRRGPVRMRPDLVFTPRNHTVPGRTSDTPSLIIDAKWKQLGQGANAGPSGVSTADFYQLYAYTRRFGADASLLLYPRPTETVRPARYLLPDSLADDTNRPRSVGIEFVDLSRDLANSSAARQSLAEELTDLVERWCDHRLSDGPHGATPSPA